MPWAARGSAKVQLRRSRVQKCKGGMLVRGRGRGRGMRTFRISGLRSRPSGAGCGYSGSGTGSGPEFCPVPAPVPDNPNQRPEGRDLRPEDASHFCTFAQAAGRFALLHLLTPTPRYLYVVTRSRPYPLHRSCPPALLCPHTPYSILHTLESGILSSPSPPPWEE